METESCNLCAKTRLGQISQATLEGFEGMAITEICDTAYIDHNLNHCAHFVSHALGLKIGMLCGDMKYNSRGKGASIRVNEIYNSCAKTGAWEIKPLDLKPCLAFVTPEGNVKGSEMGSSPSKHIGIYCGDSVWHYSNTNDKVVKDSPEGFLIKFKGVYGSKTKMYFGDFGFDVL